MASQFLYFDAAGKLLRETSRYDLPGSDRGAPPGAASALEYDDDVNPNVHQKVVDNQNGVTYLAGVLRVNGVVTAVTAPGQDYADRKAIDAIVTKLKAGTNLTAAEQTRLNRFVLVRLMRLVAD